MHTSSKHSRCFSRNSSTLISSLSGRINSISLLSLKSILSMTWFFFLPYCNHTRWVDGWFVLLSWVGILPVHRRYTCWTVVSIATCFVRFELNMLRYIRCYGISHKLIAVICTNIRLSLHSGIESIHLWLVMKGRTQPRGLVHSILHHPSHPIMNLSQITRIVMTTRIAQIEFNLSKKVGEVISL